MAYQSPYPNTQNKTLLNVGTDRAEDLYTRSLIGDGEERVGNTERTALEIKRACLHPNASLENEQVRRVRAASIGLSLYQYENHLNEMGVIWKK